MIRPLASLIVVAALSACSIELLDPRTSLEGLPEGLDAAISVQPNEVVQHAPFSVTLTVTNTAPDTIRVVTGHGCLAIPNLVHDGRRIPIVGSSWGCTAVITTHTFPPGETRTRTWEMRAELYAEHPGDPDGAPAPTGLYRVQAKFDTMVDASGEKPFAENILRVR